MVDHDVVGALEAVLRGEPAAMETIVRTDHQAIRAAGATIAAPLTLTRGATSNVLNEMAAGGVSPELAQAWASFVRRGYVERSGVDQPISPLAIEFETAREEAISQAVSRLDEIGDVIDGQVDKDQVLDLLRNLQPPEP